MTVDARQAMVAAVGGDLAALELLKSIRVERIEEQAAGLELIVEARVVAQVLAEFDAGTAQADVVQRWAEFIRWGHLPGTAGPRLSNVYVDYEAEAEDAIIEALARLDELGDIVDGELRPGEAAQLRAALMAART